jgi:hypothetical protein
MNLKHHVAFLTNIKENPTDHDNWVISYETFAHLANLHPNNLTLVNNFDFGHILTASYVIATLRYSDKIKNNMRLRFQEKIFEIKKIIEDFDGKKFIKLIILEI